VGTAEEEIVGLDVGFQQIELTLGKADDEEVVDLRAGAGGRNSTGESE
jgi:hypothetical protein